MTEEAILLAFPNEVSYFNSWYSSNEEIVFQHGINIISAILILVVGYFNVKMVLKIIRKLLNKREMDSPVVAAFALGLARYVLFTIIILACFGVLGVETSAGVVIVGAVGLAVGLAMGSSLSNFSAGVLIISFRPFKVGDYVEVGGVEGLVEAVQVFQILLKTADNKMVMLPNSVVTSSSITNFSRYAHRRVDLLIGVSYRSDLQKTKQVICDALSKDRRILKEPAITIGVLELGESSINFVVRPWCKTEDYWAVYFESLYYIKKALSENGIEIPFPRTEVKLAGLTKSYSLKLKEGREEL
ncbi:mechanosensitive ion channel protein [Vibrio diazotrophicus]|uniref:Small-conductance mechanosensitive channel n=1 Tax=Vibrio diazotrophicus TaxID=685 RepID=A0A2J8I4Y4_VIBDI|nr:MULTISPECIES: mechanosensitive ion channel domain-containing protein [Vibrio]MCF7361916.1 mechanosensitive ion channel [Vibrio sp. A1-b2]PNI05541.1 mechanosensitive ion channel protein [Vibrio diazotrophicus]